MTRAKAWPKMLIHERFFSRMTSPFYDVLAIKLDRVLWRFFIDFFLLRFDNILKPFRSPSHMKTCENVRHIPSSFTQHVSTKQTHQPNRLNLTLSNRPHFTALLIYPPTLILHLPLKGKEEKPSWNIEAISQHASKEMERNVLSIIARRKRRQWRA